MTSQYNKKQFQTAVLQGLPDGYCAVANSYFFLPNARIFSGFLAEKKPSDAIEIAEFHFPLFDGMYDVDDKIILHSEYDQDILSVKEQRIEFDTIQGDDEQAFNNNLAGEFLKRVKSKIDDVSKGMDLESFYAYLSKHNHSGLPHFQKTMGFTQILLGNNKKAMTHLTAAITHDGADKYLKQNCQAVYDLMVEDRSDAARKLLLQSNQRLQKALVPNGYPVLNL